MFLIADHAVRKASGHATQLDLEVSVSGKVLAADFFAQTGG
jgi:hypothetical protein